MELPVTIHGGNPMHATYGQTPKLAILSTAAPSSRRIIAIILSQLPRQFIGPCGLLTT